MWSILLIKFSEWALLLKYWIGKIYISKTSFFRKFARTYLCNQVSQICSTGQFLDPFWRMVRTRWSSESVFHSNWTANLLLTKLLAWLTAILTIRKSEHASNYRVICSKEVNSGEWYRSVQYWLHTSVPKSFPWTQSLPWTLAICHSQECTHLKSHVKPISKWACHNSTFPWTHGQHFDCRWDWQCWDDWVVLIC